MQKAIVVVPCYNEQNRLAPDKFVEYARSEPALSFVFVDDGSTDETFELLSAMVRRAPEQISALRQAQNVGKAEAVRRGVLSAFESAPDLIGFWDADLATPLYNIAEFARILEEPALQLAMGSRVRLLGRHVERDGLRHYIGRGFATLAALGLQLPVYDTQCGAKIFRASSIFRAVFSEPFELGWSFDVELLARFVRLSRREGSDPAAQLIEVPLREWVDAPGSKLRASHVPRIAWEIGRLFALARRP